MFLSHLKDVILAQTTVKHRQVRIGSGSPRTKACEQKKAATIAILGWRDLASRGDGLAARRARGADLCREGDKGAKCASVVRFARPVLCALEIEDQ